MTKRAIFLFICIPLIILVLLLGNYFIPGKQTRDISEVVQSKDLQSLFGYEIPLPANAKIEKNSLSLTGEAPDIIYNTFIHSLEQKGWTRTSTSDTKQYYTRNIDGMDVTIAIHCKEYGGPQDRSIKTILMLDVEDNPDAGVSTPAKVEKELSILLLQDDSTDNYRSSTAYDQIIKMGDEALFYMLACFKNKNAIGRRGTVMMTLCQEILGDRNNVKEGTYKDSQEWFQKLAPITPTDLPSFRYTGEDTMVKLVYEAALHHYQTPNEPKQVTFVAPYIYSSYEDNNQLWFFVNMEYANYKLYDKTLAMNGAGSVPAVIIYDIQSNRRYTLKDYTEGRDGGYNVSFFGDTNEKLIRKYCKLGAKPDGWFIKNVKVDYGTESSAQVMEENIQNYLKENGLKGITIKK